MSSFVLPLASTGAARRVAVKDLIDMVGLPTTAGCRVLALAARPAERDAACLAGIRAAEAAGAVRIVGKTGLNELAFGVTGLNPWFASPTNPLDPHRMVGGSSSGSAAAIGHGEADIALGSDTGGSIRIPAACCGIAGLKTTAGRIPLQGVWPLAPTMDTVGPMAATVAGLAEGLALLEPGIDLTARPARTVGRVRLPAVPAVDEAIDEALAAAGMTVRPTPLPGWEGADKAGMTVLLAEAWVSDGHLARTGGLSPEVAARLAAGAAIGSEELAAARAHGASWRAEVATVMAGGDDPGGAVEVLAMPTLGDVVPVVADAGTLTTFRHTMPWNLAGWPALSLPVPIAGAMPASLQLVAGPGGEELLLATAAVIEAALR